MNTIKVSVIIAVFNSERYLKECLNTVVEQSLKEIEIICVDDGSTDKSVDILREYEEKDERIKIITLEDSGPETGAALARNEGLKNAKGKYLSILDSDDFFELNMLEEAFNYAEKLNSDIIVFDGWRFDDKYKYDITTQPIISDKIKCREDSFSPEEIANDLFQLNIGVAWNCFYRREFVKEQNLFFQPLQHADDFFFVMSAFMRSKKIGILNKRLIHYRVANPNSQCNVKDQYVDSAYKVLDAIKKELDENIELQIFEKSFKKQALRYLLFYLNTFSDAKAFEYLYNKLRSKYLEYFGISTLSREDFLAECEYNQYKEIMDKTCVEYLYDQMLGFRKAELPTLNAYPFPYEDFKRNQKIALYGAGNVGRCYYIQLVCNPFCPVVCWVDRNYKELREPVKAPETLSKTDFDYVVIGIEEKRIVDQVKEYLKDIGVKEEKIYWNIKPGRKSEK